MRSIEWLCSRWPWVTLTTLNHLNFYILRCLMQLCKWWSQRLQIWCTALMCKSQPTDEKNPICSSSCQVAAPDAKSAVFNADEVDVVIDFLANVNVLRYVCYMRSQFRLSSVCRLSVCLSSVTLVHPTQAVELLGNFYSPYDSPGTLLFWCQKLLVGEIKNSV